jgi:hypothetical protein
MMKANITTKGWEILYLKARAEIYSDSSMEVLKQQEQLNVRNHHIPLNINIEC